MLNGHFGDCKKAKLNYVNYVQGSGGLLVIDKCTKRISACSKNIDEFLGFSAETLIGAPYPALLRDYVEPSLALVDPNNEELHQFQDVTVNGAHLIIAHHSVDHKVLIEIEHRQSDHTEFKSADMIAYLRSLAATESVEAAAELLMNTVATLTGFDRTMLYQFLPGWHGEVIAEVLRPGVDGFIGLRFPESDLPANARLLYLRNWKRAIDDVDAPAVPILYTPDCEVLDLTYSLTRAVHPAHVQYLKNIGTRASFSISIVMEGRLWGLIACHHLLPKKISLQRQTLCEHLSRMASIHISDLHALHIQKSRGAYREMQAEIRGALRSQERAMRAIGTQLLSIREKFRASGVWAYLDGCSYLSGEIPDETNLTALKSALSTFSTDDVTACGTIPRELGAYEQLVRLASGFLYIPLVDDDFLLLMRPAQTETVNWAGKPQKEEDNNAPLTPRASFQKWSQLVQGVSEPWTEVDIEAAAYLRDMLIEYGDEVRLAGIAWHDHLTGLANRHLFERKLNDAIGGCDGGDRLTALYILDLDRFKPVNDTLGHAAGDALLAQVSERLRECVRETDVVARLGGDEFAIIQYNLAGPDAAEQTALRILNEIRLPFSIFDELVDIGISIGIAMFPDHASHRDELLRCADMALYRAKDNGRDCFVIFDSDMTT